MKKLIFPLLSLVLLTTSCEKEAATQPSIKVSAVSKNLVIEKPYIRLRHGGSYRDYLGICLILGGSNLTVPNDGYPYGTATAQLQDGKLHLIFDQTTATQEGVIPITEDIVVDKFLGSERVVVKAGQYVADFSQYEFGEIYADLIVN